MEIPSNCVHLSYTYVWHLCTLHITIIDSGSNIFKGIIIFCPIYWLQESFTFNNHTMKTYQIILYQDPDEIIKHHAPQYEENF